MKKASKRIKLLTAILAVMFVSSMVPSALATSPNAWVNRYSIAAPVYGLMGEAALFNTAWDAWPWESPQYWTTLVLAEQSGATTMAEVNLKADRIPFIGGYLLNIAFTWRENGQQSGTSIPLLIYVWGSYIGLKVEKTSANVFTGYYKFSGGSWNTIGSHTYSHSWTPLYEYTGLEVTHRASNQGSHTISRWQNMKIKFGSGGSYNTWNPNFAGQFNSAAYNIKEYTNSYPYGTGYWSAGTIQ